MRYWTPVESLVEFLVNFKIGLWGSYESQLFWLKLTFFGGTSFEG